jgi:hypothetical protein
MTIAEVIPPQSDNYEETIAIRSLVDTRGRSFVVAFFEGVKEEDIAKVYYGLPVGDEAMKTIRKVLKERMTHD